MTAIDEFASSLLDEAKRFLEKAAVRDAGETAYLHAALMLGFCSLEAHTNAISDDFSKGGDLSITDQSLLRRDESGRRVQFRPTKAQIGYLSPALQALQRVWTPSHRLIGL